VQEPISFTQRSDLVTFTTFLYQYHLIWRHSIARALPSRMASFINSGRGEVSPVQGALRFLCFVSCVLNLTGRFLRRTGGLQTEAQPVSRSGIVSSRGQGIVGRMARRAAPECDLVRAAQQRWPAAGQYSAYGCRLQVRITGYWLVESQKEPDLVWPVIVPQSGALRCGSSDCGRPLRPRDGLVYA
jgi:hypothetical protein